MAQYLLLIIKKSSFLQTLDSFNIDKQLMVNNLRKELCSKKSAFVCKSLQKVCKFADSSVHARTNGAVTIDRICEKNQHRVEIPPSEKLE